MHYYSWVHGCLRRFDGGGFKFKSLRRCPHSHTSGPTRTIASELEDSLAMTVQTGGHAGQYICTCSLHRCLLQYSRRMPGCAIVMVRSTDRYARTRCSWQRAAAHVDHVGHVNGQVHGGSLQPQGIDISRCVDASLEPSPNAMPRLALHLGQAWPICNINGCLMRSNVSYGMAVSEPASLSSNDQIAIRRP